MHLFLLAALLPGLYWDQGPATAPQVKEAGVQRIYVPAGQEAAWKQQGLTVETFDAVHYVKAVAPGVEYRMDVASATRVPWVDANGWQFLRAPGKSYAYEVPGEKAALAAAEAYSYGVDAVLHCSSGNLTPLAAMLRFLRSLEAPPMPVLANIGVIDDGSETTGEVLNLMSRRNLLFRVAAAPDPKLDLNIRIGSSEYPKSEAEDPYSFSQTIRRKLGDGKRLLRLFGSDVVIGHLNGDGKQIRLHLLNYGRRNVEGLRIRVLGAFAHAEIRAAGVPQATLADYSANENGTEFSIPVLGPYAVVDLRN